MANISKLTAKRRAFCHEYIIDHNGTQAAIRAGYSDKGAAVTASRLLMDTNVIEYLGTLEEIKHQDYILSAEDVLLGVSKIAESKFEKTADRLRAYEFLGKHHDLTNSMTTRIEDWRTDAIEKIKAGTIDYDILKEVVKEFGEDESLAALLFKEAGIDIQNE